MNLTEYIASGTLELYVAGVLSPEEQRDVERLAFLHPEIKAEINKIAELIEDYSEVYAKQPPAALKNKIMAALDVPAASVKKETAKPSHSEQQVIRNIHTRTGMAFKYLAAAVVAILLTTNIIFFGKWQQADGELQTLLAQNYQLAQSYNLVKGQYEYASEELNVVSSTDFMHVPLKGLPVSPGSLAVVHWNSTSKEAFIEVKNLPVPASDKQYQLWALVDGKPVDAGTFDVGDKSFQKVKRIENAQAFAVTLEPKGGSASPTLDQMYVMAKI